MMRRVVVVCEGQTEETFVRDVLAPSFYALNLNLIGVTINTSPGYKGGALSYERVKRYLVRTLSQSSLPVVTTLIDLYQLDNQFPGFTHASQQLDLKQKLHTLTTAFHEDIVNQAGCRSERFIPHIQPHEFEALLFSDVDALVATEAPWMQAQEALKAVRVASETPEHINNHPDTKPSAQLERLLRGPNFSKTRHGPLAAQRIGLACIESACPSFAQWLEKLRRLAASP